jgi:hypothetical protein
MTVTAAPNPSPHIGPGITRGNPPETESVSAALVKPASSKSLRVPT